MASTVSTDFLFDPKVWSDHVRAYFDRKLVYGAFAVRDRTLTAEKSGLTVNFPFYNKIGDAEEPAETAALTVDNLSDDSFSATVKEIGKAIGILSKAFKKSADSVDGIVSEGQSEMARVHAEKVDKDLSTEITTPANYALSAPKPADMSLSDLNVARVNSFGDKMNDAEVCFMHSLVYIKMVNNTNTGLLKADANDPAMMVNGFMGRFLGMAIVVVDTVPVGVAGGLLAGEYLTHYHKMASYGLMTKQDIEFDEDKDILKRERIFASTEWYAVKSFHAKISADDKRAGAVISTLT